MGTVSPDLPRAALESVVSSENDFSAAICGAVVAALSVSIGSGADSQAVIGAVGAKAI